jgi:hypothetical protein
MGDAAKISPRIPATCAQNAILIIRDCNAMRDAANISPRVPSTSAQNAFLSLLIKHIIPSGQIYVAIDNPSFVPSVSCLTTSSYLWNDVRGADNISQADNLQSNRCRCSFITCTNFETGSKLSEFSAIVVSVWPNQYSTKAPSSFKSLILNCCYSCHGRRPFSAPYHLAGHCFTHSQSFCRSPPRQLWLPAH